MRVAFVTPRVPFPIDSGGRIRSFHLLRAAVHKHEVTLISAVETPADARAAEALRARLPGLELWLARVPRRNSLPRRLVRAGRNLVDPLPYPWAGYRHPRFIANVRAALAARAFDLLHCENIQVAHSVEDAETPPRVLNLHNVESVLLARAAAQAPSALRQRLMAWQAAKARRAEAHTLPRFDAGVVCSEVDAAEAQRIAPGLSLSVVPNGVDVEWFAPRVVVPEASLLVFTGAMDWLPNVDGVRFFTREVLPLLRRRVPRARLLVVGRGLTSALARELADAGVETTGAVEDVRPFLASAALVVVPLRIGGGTRLKILEAWAMGRPVLSTTIGAEGLPAYDGETLAIADDPEALAARAAALLADAGAGARLGARGRAMAESRFDWASVGRALLAAWEETSARPRRAAGGAAAHAPGSSAGPTVAP
jgi:sugar transferase (PEP-CTERM/EpsH1 system associated)